MNKVSVILPTYNRVNFLYIRIKEFFEQKKNYNNLELIIVDDNSSDGTQKLCEELKNFNFIKYIKLEKNSTCVSIPRAIGIVNSDGEYIAHQDDDCITTPDKYNILSEILDNNNNCTLAYGAMLNNLHQSFIENYNAESYGVDNSQILYRRSIYTELNVPIFFPKRACDWKLMNKINSYKPNSFIGINKIVAQYIWHGGNRSLNENTKYKQIYPEDYKSYFHDNRYTYDYNVEKIG